MAKLKDGTYNNNKIFQENQKKWIETQDVKWLWESYPLMLHAVKSCMTKRLKGLMIPNFNEKAEESTIYWIEREIKYKDNPTTRLMGYASFLAMRALYGKSSKMIDSEVINGQSTVSLDEMVENGYEPSCSYDFEDYILDKLSSK